MHTGLDLLANSGTPIHAAADGLVVGAKLNGLYGNWVRIDHPGKLVTVYGHLLRFAPDIEPGTVVKRGDVIGFVGSTGRSTGAHLHFELLIDGHPVNPAGHPATKPRQLAGSDLDRLRKQLAASLRERELEHEADETVALSLGQPMHPI
jgi:murein DD-endopeptidase MepM/ murein hydrolase activator NlpD